MSLGVLSLFGSYQQLVLAVGTSEELREKPLLLDSLQGETPLRGFRFCFALACHSVAIEKML